MSDMMQQQQPQQHQQEEQQQVVTANSTNAGSMPSNTNIMPAGGGFVTTTTTAVHAPVVNPPVAAGRRPSKFAEGRLKLSTSCTECHRRKQKCDQKQPCKNCSRRFPLPQCVYRTLKDSSPSTEATISNNVTSHVRSENTSRIPFSGSDRRNGTTSFVFSEAPGSVEKGKLISQHAGPRPPKRISSELLLDNWGPSEYQEIVGAMVGNIEDTLVVEGDGKPDDESESPRQFGNLGEEGHADLKSLQIARRQQKSQSPPSRFSITSVDPLHYLGVVPTSQNGELLHAFLKIITRYVVSLDGAVVSNYYNDIWVPWCMKSPLLTYMAIFTASCYQSETQRIPPPESAVVLGYKLKTIELLNEMLSNKETATCTEAIAAVGYLCTNEWYWQNYDNVKAHLRGLKEMIRLRGGLGELSDFQRKTIIITDYQISCSYEIDLTFPHTIATYIRYPAPMSCPLLYSLLSFSSIHAEIGIVPETATILDHMRFIIMAVLKLLDHTTYQNQNPSSSSDTPHSKLEEEMFKLSTTTKWIENTILSLPDGNEKTSPLSKDFIYKSCRTAALIYCRAVLHRTPLSQACTLQDLNQLWSSMWRVTLTQWKRIPGIFVWVILAGNAAAQVTPHGRFLKNMFKAVSTYMGMEYFDVIDAALMNYARLQRWLRGVEGNAVLVQQPRRVRTGGSGGGGRNLPYLHNYK